MSKKSDKRAARTAAAQSRDADLVEQAKRDPMLLDWMRESRKSDPAGFARAAAMSRYHAARPSSPDYQRALVAVGGLAALDSAPNT